MMREMIFKTALWLQGLQDEARKGMVRDDFVLYLKMWELLALNAPDVLRHVEVMRPSEIDLVDDTPDMPDVFGDFINSLDL